MGVSKKKKVFWYQAKEINGSPCCFYSVANSLPIWWPKMSARFMTLKSGHFWTEKGPFDHFWIAKVGNTAFMWGEGGEKVHQSFILLQTIKDVDLQALESLEYINLSRNLIREIMPGTFLGMPNLLGLDFSVNAVIKVNMRCNYFLESILSLNNIKI